jgi:NDP-sugar pyrophosphorylase family protein
MSSRALATLILAAGKGTRMKSERPKVLHDVCGRPMLAFPLAAAEALAPRHLVVVVGRGADAVRSTFAERAQFVAQEEQRGTGHAVLQCRAALEGFHGDVIVLYADTPLLRAETLEAMIRHKADTGADLVLLSAPVQVPGIVIRDERPICSGSCSPRSTTTTPRARSTSPISWSSPSANAPGSRRCASIRTRKRSASTPGPTSGGPPSSCGSAS